MKIRKLTLHNFMIFNNIETEFSPNINIICGENSTGKTALIKLMYSCIKGCSTAENAKGEMTKEKLDDALVAKLQGVFRPEKDVIGRLVNRRQGSAKAEISLDFDSGTPIEIGFSTNHKRHVEITSDQLPTVGATSAVYIPPKEIISSTENFVSLYADYHIAFEETYYDLARLLERPLKKGPNTAEQNAVLSSFGKIVDGTIIQRDKVFYLKVKGAGEFEMGLVSEGYRKLTTIMYLIQSGSLSKNAILFWDEPETNMNPKMVQPVVDAIVELANLGVQVFVTTHDYFVQQCFSMAAKYKQDKKKPIQYNFMSLNRTENGIELESSNSLFNLKHNAVMEEFDDLYDREQRLLYGN